MSCHHHQPHHCSCCCSSSNGSSNTRCCSPNSVNNSDQLLQTLALLLHSQSQPHPQIYLKPQRHRPSPPPPPPPPPQPKDDHHRESLILRSLIRRVAALESSLSSKRATFTPPPQPLKHSAAVTIQRHFRRFLARRSRTLRDLKQLAVVKADAAALRSSISSKAVGGNPRAASQEAMDLLLKLDSIQSCDPMIREGKRSISRELVRVLEFVEKVLTREREEEDEDERDSRVNGRRRRVSFAENGDEAQVFDDLSERILEVETDGGVEGFYFNRFSDGSDEESPKVGHRANGNGTGTGNRRSGLTAPVPMKMELKRNVSVS